MDERTIDVDGTRLVINIDGSGPPPVVFVSALGDDQSEWKGIQAALTVDTTQVSYGRPGLGGSPPLPEPLRGISRTFGWAADQLVALLDAAGVPSPRILVGHSIGGLIIEQYAVRAPEQLAGLVFVDSSDPGLFFEAGKPLELIDGDDQSGGIRFDAFSSLAEHAAVAQVPHVPAVVVSSAVGRWFRVKNPERYAPLSLAELDQRWQEHQHRLAKRFAAKLLVAHDAGHRLDSEAPALVARAVDAVVEATRHDGTIHFDPASLHPAGGVEADVSTERPVD